MLTTKEEAFGQIHLDVAEKDLYSAWDKNFYADIEGYKVDDTHAVHAIQESWIKRPPNVLLLHVQRVAFDKEKSTITTNPYR